MHFAGSSPIFSDYSEPTDLEFSVPQGSVLGPQLFSIYASTLGDVISRHKCKLNGFADDHTLHNTFAAGNILSYLITDKHQHIDG